MYSQLLRLWVVWRARSAWRVVCARFLIGYLRDDGPRWCLRDDGMSRRHVVVAARWLAPSPLESEVTAARRSRAEVALVVVRMVEERRSCGGRWPSGDRHKNKTKQKSTFFWPQPHAATQQSRTQKHQKGPDAYRQRRLLAAVFSRPPSKANSAQQPARVRHEQPEQPEHAIFPHNAPPLVRLEQPEQRTTAGPVDREHPVFVRLVRVKIVCRFPHCWPGASLLSCCCCNLP